MTEYWCYYLQPNQLSEVLPKLVKLALERDWQTLIHVASNEEADFINGLLWSFEDSSFLPHALSSEDDGETPIIITATGEVTRPFEAHFFLGGLLPDNNIDCQRVTLVFESDAGIEQKISEWQSKLPPSNVKIIRQTASGWQ